MADISNIELLGTRYKIKDEVGRKYFQNAISNIDNLSQKKFVFVGDSYAEGYTPDGNVNSWIDVFTALANITNYTKYFQGGTGFTTSPSFTSLISSVPIDTQVDYVIAGGGYNDNGNSNVPNSIKLFYNTAKIKYPNAKIFVGFFGWSLVNATIQRNLILTCGNYKKGCEGSLNLFYLYGIENVIFDQSHYSSDGFHPNQDGQNSIAYAMYQAFCRGTYVGSVINNYDIPNSNSATTDTTPMNQLFIKTYNGIAQIAWGRSEFTYSKPQSVHPTGSDPLLVSTITKSALLTANTFGLQCSCPVIYRATNSKYYSLPTNISIEQGKIYLYPVAIKETYDAFLDFQCESIQIPPFSFSFSIWAS